MAKLGVYQSKTTFNIYEVTASEDGLVRFSSMNGSEDHIIPEAQFELEYELLQGDVDDTPTIPYPVELVESEHTVIELPYDGEIKLASPQS